MTLRKTFSALAAVLLGVVVVAVALAGNTNFTKTSACWTTISTGTCTTSSGATTAALASTSFDATTAVAPTSQIPTEVFLHGVFSGTGQGGNFTLTASVLTCPSGQVASVLEAHATKLIITNTNNGDSASVPDADVVYLAT
jgi:hypothetical protein